MLQTRIIIYLVLVSVLLYSCRPEGCTDYKALNYDADAVKDDGSCIPKIYGCMDSTSRYYNPAATVDDSTCMCTGWLFNGAYNITSICVPVYSPSNVDTTEYVMEIYEDSLNPCKVNISHYLNSSVTKSFFVSENNILVPLRTDTNVSDDFANGWVSNYYTTITLSNDTLYIHTSLKVNGDLVRYCDMIGIKQ